MTRRILIALIRLITNDDGTDNDNSNNINMLATIIRTTIMRRQKPEEETIIKALI